MHQVSHNKLDAFKIIKFCEKMLKSNKPPNGGAEVNYE